MKLWRTMASHQGAQAADAARRVVLRPEAIGLYNRSIIAQSSSVYDLSVYPASLTAEAVGSLTCLPEVMEDTLYANGRALTTDDRQAVLRERHLAALAPQSPVRYGIVVRRANLRALPTSNGWFTSPADQECDVLQESAVDPSEPVVILHTSAAGTFDYVQMRNYRGWMKADDIALTPRAVWLSYVQPADFLVVTANRYTVPGDEPTLYQMGAKIVLRRHAGGMLAAVPRRNAAGTLREETMHLAESDALHCGFLPYTRSQIIAQSFRFLQDPYGWGGLKNSVDCSSFIAAIYRTVGVELPRNADEQARTAGIYTSLRNGTALERQARLHDVQPGDALFFDGHAMLYLGETNGVPQIIHALGSHTRHHADGTKEKIRTMQVIVSDLSLRRFSGISFFDALSGAMSFH